MAGGLGAEATASYFHFASGFDSHPLAHMLDSLVRVSRREKENHLDSGSWDSRIRTGASPGTTPQTPTDDDGSGHSVPTASDGENMAQILHWFPSLPFQQFQVLFNSLFKVLCTFPSRYLYTIGLPPIFSFGWNLPPA